MSQTNLVGAIVTVPCPESNDVFAPKTAPKRLFKAFRIFNGKREWLLTPNFYHASSFMACEHSTL